MTRAIVILVLALVLTPVAASRPVDEGCVHVRAESVTLEARRIHALWLAEIEAGRVPPEKIVLVGSAEWHRLWIENYNVVLEALSGKKGSCP